MRLFGGESFKKMMSKVGMKPGEPIYHPLLNRTIEGAQKKVEERNFEIRKHLLEYDDVLNKQRGFIYEQRDLILKDEDLVGRVSETVQEMLEMTVAEAAAKIKAGEKGVAAGLTIVLRDSFGVQLPATEITSLLGAPQRGQGDGSEGSALKARIADILKKDLEEKLVAAGRENLNLFIRYQYLQEIDAKWLDHLETMEALREAVYLRSYAQKNPLLEYKLEGSDIFEQLVESIRKSIASRVMLVRIKPDEERKAPAKEPLTSAQAAARHDSSNQFGDAAETSTRVGAAVSGMDQRPRGSAISDASRPENASAVRVGEKIGRNDPCPCGSGKKYKHCHGR
jgi:preprotein translocase subunit SecA